jgi:hypothetical protein
VQAARVSFTDVQRSGSLASCSAVAWISRARIGQFASSDPGHEWIALAARRLDVATSALLLDVQIDTEQDQPPQENGQYRRSNPLDRAEITEVVVLLSND